MRMNCKHYESRSYASGETVRKCDLDLAPDAPWRCPDDCSAFTPRLVDIGWQHGSLIAAPPPPEPPGLEEGAAQLLDAAEEIINSAGPQILAEMQAEAAKPWWRRWGRRRLRRG